MPVEDVAFDVEYLVVAQVIAERSAAGTRPLPTEAKGAAQISLFERAFARDRPGTVDVDAGREILIQEIRLGEAEVRTADRGPEMAKSSRRSWPRPSRFRSRMLTLPSGPSAVEKPAPNESSPVDCSSTLTSTTVRSGRAALQRLDIHLAEEAEILNPLPRAPELGALKASPSTTRNSRRITSSRVRTLPLMSIRST